MWLEQRVAGKRAAGSNQVILAGSRWLILACSSDLSRLHPGDP